MIVRKVAVGEIMTRNYTSVKPNTDLLEAARCMVKENVGSLVIVEGKKLIGIITQKDILWAITKKPGLNLKEVRCSEIAARKVAVIKPSADIAQAFLKMRQYGFRRLPVVSRGEIVGLLTLKDILKVEPAFYSKAGELVNVREESEKLKRVSEDEWDSEGFCDECGSFADLLKVNSRVLCPDCRDELY